MSRLEWKVPRKVTASKAAAAVLFFAVAIFYAGDPSRWTAAMVASAVLGAFAVRDLLVPVRLAADADGVTVVHGFARRRRIPWTEVERLRIDARQRLGRRDVVLEIDTGEGLYLFGARELGADLEDVAARLTALRAGSPA
ncbi:MAG TPA: PH domain-containing protein [Mycobacteriales bacterium]|nr:PH domain-containing protein [Mycobacteriales bacterium]